MGEPAASRLGGQLRAVSVAGRGRVHVERARRCPEPLAELDQEHRSHRRVEIIASRRGPRPAGIDVGGNKMVGDETHHRVHRPSTGGQDLDDRVGWGEPAGASASEAAKRCSPPQVDRLVSTTTPV